VEPPTGSGTSSGGDLLGPILNNLLGRSRTYGEKSQAVVEYAPSRAGVLVEAGGQPRLALRLVVPFWRLTTPSGARSKGPTHPNSWRRFAPMATARFTMGRTGSAQFRSRGSDHEDRGGAPVRVSRTGSSVSIGTCRAAVHIHIRPAQSSGLSKYANRPTKAGSRTAHTDDQVPKLETSLSPRRRRVDDRQSCAGEGRPVRRRFSESRSIATPASTRD